jgi:hypothetical protein
VRRLKPDLPGPALCLVGPPGTGKTSLGAAVARALQRPFVRINVSGTSDVGEIKGVSRTLPGAQPGKLVRAVREAGVSNPVLMIDGVDRLIGEGGLGVCEVLLDLLDPENSGAFVDHYLGLPCDLSHACCCCARTHRRGPELLERIGSSDPRLQRGRKVESRASCSASSTTTVSRATCAPVETLRAIVRHYAGSRGARAVAPDRPCAARWRGQSDR